MGYMDEGQPAANHGTTTGTSVISSSYPRQTMATATTQNWNVSFPPGLPKVAVKLVVTGGTPTISLVGGTPVIAADSDQTLTTMAVGTYLVKGESFDNGVTSEWFISKVA